MYACVLGGIAGMGLATTALCATVPNQFVLGSGSQGIGPLTFSIGIMSGLQISYGNNGTALFSTMPFQLRSKKPQSGAIFSRRWRPNGKFAILAQMQAGGSVFVTFNFPDAAAAPAQFVTALNGPGTAALTPFAPPQPGALAGGAGGSLGRLSLAPPPGGAASFVPSSFPPTGPTVPGATPPGGIGSNPPSGGGTPPGGSGNPVIPVPSGVPASVIPAVTPPPSPPVVPLPGSVGFLASGVGSMALLRQRRKRRPA